MRKIYRYCPFCAAELAPKRIAGRRLKACPACGFVDYANARPTAGAVIVNEKNEVLLARRAGLPFKGYWNLPGGFLESDEHPQNGVAREVKEETGLEVTAPKLIGVRMDTYNDPHQGFFHTLNTYYSFRVRKPVVTAADDASELRFFPLDQLPRMAFACDVWAVEEYRKKSVGRGS
jgi:ADP-ribose pyrophosphatase YjhB (NUDIX family)